MTNLLQRIYDAANDVVTADVDNTNTTTDTLEASDSITVKDSKIKGLDVEIADDDVATIDVTGDTILQIVGNAELGTSGFVLTSFDSLDDSLTTDKLELITSTQLTGTTGNDGVVSISRVDNTLYVENRIGETSKFEFLNFNG